MAYLTRAQLESLPTPRLLAYKNSLLKVPETADWDNLCAVPGGGKQHPEWKAQYALVKEILADREHIPKRKCG